MFHFLATTKCKRQQIAILIISFFAYVAGIRNEGNNMLLQQQKLRQQQHTTTENSDNKRPIIDMKLQSTSNFRPSQVIDFTPADAALPQQFKTTYIQTPHSTNNNENIHNDVSLKQEIQQSSNRRYAIETAAPYGDAAEKPFSFPNEQQQTPQHLKDKPIYIYRDPFTNENYHYTPTETHVKTTTVATTYNHNNYNNEHNLHQHLQHYDGNQEYLVQSSMTVGTHLQQQHQQQQQEINPPRPYMSLSADKDVYLKRPGFVYDETPNHNHPNSVTDKKSQANKISYDSHDYPPPSYFQQQTSNFLPTPVPEQPPTSAPILRPTASPTLSSYQSYRPPPSTHSTIFVPQQPLQQYTQSSQSASPNYANSIDNYLLNKQQTSEFYRTETPPPPFSQQPHVTYQYENRPPLAEYDFPHQTTSPTKQHKQQYFSRPPPFNSAQIPYRQHETARPPPSRPSYNNYYGYQIGEIPPQAQTSSLPSQYFNYPYPRPPTPQYPYQGPYRPPTPPPTQQSSLAALAQYAPQFTSLLLGGVGGGGGGTANSNGPLGSLIGALTSAATSQQLSSPPSFNRRPVNSQLIKALENIARNDDLQCVPKVLCQMIAAQTQRGQLPTFITSPAITNFLAGFPAASPALIYGRAALLGLSGGDKSCHQTYVSCPKDEYEIIYYLNNHRGGFFKFFSEPEEQQQPINHNPTQQNTSLFSILSALAGAPHTTTTTPRPTPKPQPPPAHITGEITNFFTQLLSDYVGGAAVEYQRRLKRRSKRSLDGKVKFEGQIEENHKDSIKFQDESLQSQRDVFKFKDQQFDESEDGQQESDEDFHDEEDGEDTQHGFEFKDNREDYGDSTQSRILHKNLERSKSILLFPEMRKETRDEIDVQEELKQKIKKFNDYNKERKLKFPTATDNRMYTEVTKERLNEGESPNDGLLYGEQSYGHQFLNYVQNSFKDFEKEKQKVKFIDNNDGDNNDTRGQQLFTNYLKRQQNLNTGIIFPEREAKILNHFHYAASYWHDNPPGQQNQEANHQTSLHYTDRPSSPNLNIYNTYTNTQNSISPNVHIENNHFLPTLPPQDNYASSSNSVYSNQNYNNNQHKQSSNLQYSPVLSPSTSYLNNNNRKKPAQAIFNRYHSSFYTTSRPYSSEIATKKPDSKNIYVTNSEGITEYYITPDGRKIYL